MSKLIRARCAVAELPMEILLDGNDLGREKFNSDLNRQTPIEKRVTVRSSLSDYTLKFKNFNIITTF